MLGHALCSLPRFMHLQAPWLVDSRVLALKHGSRNTGMVCAVCESVCPGLHGVTLAGRILKLRDLKLREDGHLCVTTQPFRPFNRHVQVK